jgi:hypothetical protein
LPLGAACLSLVQACTSEPFRIQQATDAGAQDASISGRGGSGAGAAASGGRGGSGSGGSRARAGSGAAADGGQGGRTTAGDSAGQPAAGQGGSSSPQLPVLGAPLTPGDVGEVAVKLEVRTDREPLRFISKDIYGTNGAPEISNTRQTVVRSGGNRMTAYNWETNASNAGSDWMFQNDSFLSDSDEPAKPVLDTVKEAVEHGAAAIVTIPIVDYVAADKNGDGDVRNSGSSYLTLRFKQNSAKKSGAYGDPNVNDETVYQDEFVAYIEAHAPAGSRVLFSMDNEPDAWSSTHAEVHPDKVTYAELWERNQRYAKSVKEVWPSAEVLGFVSYGFNGYVNLQDAPDANGRDFIEWYLDQAQAAKTAGKQLIDYLDLHWYPEARGGGTRVTEMSTADAVVAAREQAPRSLWDDTYNEQSWVRDYLGEPVKLLPRLFDKIAQHNPGTKLAFTEWNFGAGHHISGAIASADVLGVFGREGVSLATYWGLQEDERFAYAAFRAYRNYDGAGGEFGDVALFASSSDIEHVTVYASLHAVDPQHVVLIAINKHTQSQEVGLQLAHPHKFGTLARYQLAGASAELSEQPALNSVGDNAWKISLPAQSVSVLVPE